MEIEAMSRHTPLLTYSLLWWMFIVESSTMASTFLALEDLTIEANKSWIERLTIFIVPYCYKMKCHPSSRTYYTRDS
jgi:hypothetical protein